MLNQTVAHEPLIWTKNIEEAHRLRLMGVRILKDDKCGKAGYCVRGGFEAGLDIVGFVLLRHPGTMPFTEIRVFNYGYNLAQPATCLSHTVGNMLYQVFRNDDGA